jgi:hypothetical protein
MRPPILRPVAEAYWAVRQWWAWSNWRGKRIERAEQAALTDGSVGEHGHRVLHRTGGTGDHVPLFGIHISQASHVGIGLIFMVASIARSYALRRAFNWWHVRGIA